jgi:MFS family permease
MHSSKPASGQAARKRGLLINADFALLWSGQAISKLGDVVFDHTLVFWIATSIAREQRWAPLAVSGIFVATALATLGAGPIAGVFVDRWPKRPTMLLMDALRALLLVLLLLVTGILPPPLQLPPFGQLGAIYLVVVLATICTQFFDPSRLALVGDLVSEPDRAHATGLLEVTRNLAVVVGPPVAALLYFRFGALWALLINALSFLVSFLALLVVHVSPSVVRPQSGPQTHFRREFGSGPHFLLGNRVLMTILVTSVVGMFGISAFSTLGIFFALQNLQIPASLSSFLSLAFGVGAILGAVLAGFFAQRLGVARTFWLSILVLSGLLLVYARQTSFAPAVGVSFLLGIPYAAIGVASDPLLLHVTPPALIGRMFSVIITIVMLSMLVSTALVGYLASTVLHDFHTRVLGLAFGPIDMIFTVGSLCALLAGMYAMVNLRGLHLVGRRTGWNQK